MLQRRNIKLDRANKSILLRALGNVYYAQKATGSDCTATGALVLRIHALPPKAADWRWIWTNIGWQGMPSTSCAPGASPREAIPTPWMMRCAGFCKQLFLMVKFPQPLAFHKNYDEIRIRKREVSNMIQIRPVSDLRNKYPEVERLVTQQQQPVFLTKNGYGSMVVMSIDQYTALIDGADAKLDEADAAAKSDPVRLSHEEVFGNVRAQFRGRK